MKNIKQISIRSLMATDDVKYRNLTNGTRNIITRCINLAAKNIPFRVWNVFENNAHIYQFGFNHNGKVSTLDVFDTFQSQSKHIGDGQCVVECTAIGAGGLYLYKEFFYENGARCSPDEMVEANEASDIAMSEWWASEMPSFEKMAWENFLQGFTCDRFDHNGNVVPYLDYVKKVS
jgi:hypothetical protein